MRLTLVIASLTRGGAERVLSFLANTWAQQGKDVILLSFDHGEAPAYPLDAAVRHESLGLLGSPARLGWGVFENLSRVRKLRSAIRDSRPDVVLSFLHRTNVLTLLATRGMSVPVVISERTDPALHDIGSIWDFLRRMVYPLADTLVCPLEPSLARFQALIRVSGKVIPNPVAVPAPSAETTVHESTRSHPIVIAMGRLVYQKGFDLLLLAFAQIAARHPEWTLTVLGSGPLGGQLCSQAETLGLGRRVYFAGAVADPFPWLCRADLFVFSSRFEGFGMALAEAMACGLPAVSFDCPEGPAAILRHGIDGLLVPPGDVAALAAAMDALMGDAQRRRSLAHRALEVCERFSPDKAISLWERFFDEVRAARKNPLREARMQRLAGSKRERTKR